MSLGTPQNKCFEFEPRSTLRHHLWQPQHFSLGTAPMQRVTVNADECSLLTNAAARAAGA